MKNFKYWAISFLFLGNLAFLSALSFHIVWSQAGLSFVPKAQLSLVDTLVNTRHWNQADWSRHAALLQRLSDAGLTSIVEQATAPQTSARPTDQEPVITAHRRPRTVSLPATRPAATEQPPQNSSQPGTIFDFGMNP